MLSHLLFKISVYFNYHLKALSAQGLHSPFLFDLYNEVIVGDKEFYFFKQFREILSKCSKSSSEANALFLYRWTAFYRPNSVFVPRGDFTASLALSVVSLQKTLSVLSLQSFSKYEKSVFKDLDISVLEGGVADLIYLDEIRKHSSQEILNYSCVIISKPHENKFKDSLWKELCALKPVSISIDLFQFGILLLHKNQAKQHFVVKMR